jgi:hypothetical protein
MAKMKALSLKVLHIVGGFTWEIVLPEFKRGFYVRSRYKWNTPETAFSNGVKVLHEIMKQTGWSWVD